MQHLAVMLNRHCRAIRDCFTLAGLVTLIQVARGPMHEIWREVRVHARQQPHGVLNFVFRLHTSTRRTLREDKHESVYALTYYYTWSRITSRRCRTLALTPRQP